MTALPSLPRPSVSVPRPSIPSPPGARFANVRPSLGVLFDRALAVLALGAGAGVLATAAYAADAVLPLALLAGLVRGALGRAGR